MGTDLTRIGVKARKEPNTVFTSLYHHVVDVDNLRACYDALEPNKATGVDGVTKPEYGENLVQNLQDLSMRLKDMTYRPQPKRRSYVPKPGSDKGRPLGNQQLRRQAGRVGAQAGFGTDLRTGIRGQQLWVPTESELSPMSGRIGTVYPAKPCKLCRGSRHQKLFRQSKPPMDDQVP